eukprot:TRINITY_DN15491_c6_g2_i1.p3 TRINITY_DN15491_c6_g2~~TRINITY_DN15491_c6_g2_i1.p3  ORF type:complete len:125 (-),score=8.46 TRINITY_DN15491_c6_g2_i1:272-646(-)
MSESNFICEHNISEANNQNTFRREKCKFCDTECDSGRIISVDCGCVSPQKTKAHEKCAKNWFCYLAKQQQLPDVTKPNCLCNVCKRTCQGILSIMIKKQSGKWVTRNELLDKKNRKATWGCRFF